MCVFIGVCVCVCVCVCLSVYLSVCTSCKLTSVLIEHDIDKLLAIFCLRKPFTTIITLATIKSTLATVHVHNACIVALLHLLRDDPVPYI